MRLYSLLISFIILLGLNACGGTAPQVPKEQAPLPAWINSVLPDDTQTTMYGMAIAKNRDLAIKMALSDMISRLGVKIESSYESVEKSNSYRSSLDVKNSIKSEVSQIKINNYKVIKAYRVSYREFAVMVSSNKQQFIAGLQADLQVKKAALKEKEATLKTLDTFAAYRLKKSLMQEAKQLVSMVLMLGELDASYNKMEDMQSIEHYTKQYIQASASLHFFVKGDTKSQNFVSVVKNNLIKHGFRVSRSAKGAVVLALKTTDYVSKGIRVITLHLSVYDKKNRLGGKTIIMKEYNNGSEKNAYKNAAIHFQEDLNAGEIEFYQLLTP